MNTTKNGTGTMNETGNNGMDGKIDSIKDSVKGFVETGHEKVDQIKAKAIDVKEQAMTRGNALLDQTCDLIKAHPLKSVGVAFGVGYIGMRLLRR